MVIESLFIFNRVFMTIICENPPDPPHPRAILPPHG
jgi:hypothetical protein